MSFGISGRAERKEGRKEGRKDEVSEGHSNKSFEVKKQERERERERGGNGASLYDDCT